MTQKDINEIKQQLKEINAKLTDVLPQPEKESELVQRTREAFPLLNITQDKDGDAEIRFDWADEDIIRRMIAFCDRYGYSIYIDFEKSYICIHK